MATDELLLKEVLQAKRICVAGISRKRKFGNDIYVHLKNNGYNVIPVNANLKEFHGDKCYSNLSEITEKPDLVILTVKASSSIDILNDCIKNGVNKVLLVNGSYNKDVLEFCQKNNIHAVYKTCPFLLFNNFGFHKIHKTINSIFSIQPKTV
jgi:predicted CoA-binding protein